MLNRKLVEKLRETSGPPLVNEIIDLYLSDQDSLLGQIRAALSQRNASQLEDRAHALKGCSADLGAVGIRVLSEELERLALAGDLIQAAAAFDLLEAEASVVRRELELERHK